MEVKPASGFTLQTIACSDDLFPLANSTVATVPAHYGRGSTRSSCFGNHQLQYIISHKNQLATVNQPATISHPTHAEIW